MRSQLKYIFVILVLVFSHQAKAQSVDYKAQTLFIYNFIKYVNWPSLKDENFRVAVFGQSPL
jgi:YfiR/HmsC-like